MERLKTAQTAIEIAGKKLEDLGGNALSPLARKSVAKLAMDDLAIAKVQIEDYVESHTEAPEEFDVEEEIEDNED
jgi:hypothetical protein